MTKEFKKGVLTVELTDADIEKFTELVNEHDVPFALMLCLYMQAEKSNQISTPQFIASICALKNLFCENDWEVTQDEKGIFKMKVSN